MAVYEFINEIEGTTKWRQCITHLTDEARFTHKRHRLCVPRRNAHTKLISACTLHFNTILFSEIDDCMQLLKS